MKWFKKRQAAKRPSVLMQKVENIEQSVQAIERALSEQAAQKSAAHPPVVNCSDASYESFEPFEPFEEVSDE